MKYLVASLLCFVALAVDSCVAQDSIAVESNLQDDGYHSRNRRAAPCNAAVITTYPYQVSIVNELTICAGAIISNLWVLTSAMCALYGSVPNTRIRSGSNYWGVDGLVTNVTLRYVHPEFSFVFYDADIALLQVSTAFVFGTSRNKIKLPRSGQSITTGAVATFPGWGTRCQGTNVTSTLTTLPMTAINMPVMSPAVCAATFNYSTVFAPYNTNTVCASVPVGGELCKGDLGGPMVLNNLLVGVYKNPLTGVDNFGQCENSTVPTRATRVSPPIIRSWILTNAGI